MGTTTDLFLKVRRRFPHFCCQLICGSCGFCRSHCDLLLCMMAALSWRSSDRPNVDYSALTCTDSNSGLHREFPSDSIASSAVSLPLSNASLRSEERRVGKECRSRWSPYH